ncbi:MAG: alpha/beta hydrolase [Anaerovoracaceae bacterium]
MYTKERSSFSGSNGIDTVSYQTYTPDGKPKAIVQIAHGMAEHFGRYQEFAEYLAGVGFVVCGNDHLGHGETAPTQEDLGYFGKNDGWINMTDDLHLLTLKMKQKYGNLPYFLIGHSMGSLLTRAYLSSYGKELSGAVLIGTSGENPAAKAALPLISLIRKAKGDRHRSGLIYYLAFGNYNKRYEKGSRKLAWMSQDDEVLNAFKADPKCNFILTVAGFRDLMKVLIYVSRKDWASEVPQKLPVILLSGDKDPVGDFGQGTRQVFKQLQMAKVEDLSLKLYPGLRHEILNEPGKEQIHKDILEWLQKHI